MAKVFLIGIGGTGMRCLESFVHTCAMGMYDDTEVEMLALDTDKDNGNFVRLRKLVENYNKINGGIVKRNTFFSAKIRYYEFSPGYTTNDSFAGLSKYERLNTNRAKDPSADFVDMFISDDVRNMNLKDGYRAQTQMGSLLMYYAIEQAAYEAQNNLRSRGTNDLRDFLSSMNAGNRQPVFVFGSVFGGTGASSIPIIPLAFRKADRIFGRNSNIVDSNYFGSIVLTNYFKFDVRDSLNEVVARSENFAINSQSALMFYKEDATVASTYRRLYLLGRHSDKNRDVLDPANGGSRGVTGGQEQKNPADYIELLAAFAAYHFFKEAKKEEPFKDDQDKRFFCLSHDYGTKKLDFRLFAQEDEQIFKEKIGALTVASLLDLKGTDFFASMANERNMFESVDSNGIEMDALHQYFALFNVGLDSNDNIVRGWLPQMNAGRGGQGLFFDDALFSCKNLRDLSRFRYNKHLFVGDNPPRFDVGLLSSIFDTVKRKFISTDVEKRGNFDDLLSRAYSTIMKLYFNN